MVDENGRTLLIFHDQKQSKNGFVFQAISTIELVQAESAKQGKKIKLSQNHNFLCQKMPVQTAKLGQNDAEHDNL